MAETFSMFYKHTLWLVSKCVCIRNILAFALFLSVMSNTYAQLIPYTEEEKKVLDANMSKMTFWCSMSSDDGFAELVHKYNVVRDVKQELMGIVTEREWKKAILNYSIPDRMERYIRKCKLDSIYQRHIDAVLMPYNDIAGKAIMTALRHKKNIRISDDSYQKIVDGGLVLIQAKREGKTISIKDEVDVLMKTLTPGKVLNVLAYKNIERANTKAHESWMAVSSHDWVNIKDSVEVCKEFSNYYVDCFSYEDMFSNDSSNRYFHLNNVYENKPVLLAKLDSITEIDKIKKVSNDYKWNDK